MGRTLTAALIAALTIAILTGAGLPSVGGLLGASSASAQFSKLPRTSCPAQSLSFKDKLALKVLQQPPFPPTDVSLFTPQTYPDAPPMQPAGPYSFTEASLKAKLALLLARRFFGDLRKIRAGLAVYDDAATKAVVPDPRLRMALALLKGTAGEAAISAIRTDFISVTFVQLPPEASAAFAGRRPGDPKNFVGFHVKYQHEDPQPLAAILAHEALHPDIPDSLKEELVNNAVEALVYAQFVGEDSNLAPSGTELIRRQNTKLLALLNSRDEQGRLRLTVSQGNVYPGGQPLAYFAAAFEPLGADMPGNPTLQAILKAVTKVRLPAPNFDDVTVALLDTCQRLFSPSQVLRLARSLKLDTTARGAAAAAQ
jgi:hypothetical protein